MMFATPASVGRRRLEGNARADGASARAARRGREAERALGDEVVEARVAAVPVHACRRARGQRAAHALGVRHHEAHVGEDHGLARRAPVVQYRADGVFAEPQARRQRRVRRRVEEPSFVLEFHHALDARAEHEFLVLRQKSPVQHDGDLLADAIVAETPPASVALRG